MASSPPLLLLFLFLCSPFLVLVLVLVLAPPSHALNGEGFALLTFKTSIREDPGNSLLNWNSSDPNPCSWNGVTCISALVVSLSLPKKRLVGSLPSSLGSLTSLRHLNLRTNRLFGRVPSGLFAAVGLQSLVLYGNSLYSPLPSEIGNLAYLQILDLSHNLLNGSLPYSLIQCKRLKTLVLSHNNFTNSLPDGFGSSLLALEKLDLSYNRLGNLPEKVYIDLTYNNLSGPIPQNGALENRGPTAFIGNPGLCGPPLKNPCSSDVPSSNPYLPSNYSPSGVEASANLTGSGHTKGLSRNAVVAIVVSDVIGIGLIALLFFYCYWRAISSRENEEGGNSDKGTKCRKDCNCFRKEESETPSEDIEQYDLVPLDRHVRFDLDELLKASAFVLGKSGIGIVYKVVMEDGVTLAVRRLGEGGLQRFKEFQTEVEAIGKVRHPNIVTLRAYYWSVDEKLLIYDYIPNGNLTAAIHGKAGVTAFTPLLWDVRLKIMQGIARGLAFLHEFSPKKYVHGDLRPNNVLLGMNMEPYISDFGLGRLANIAGGSPFLQSDRMAAEKTPTHNPISQSPVVLLETLEIDLVRWVQSCIEEKKPLADVLDPSLSREVDREDEMIAVLKIALACVQANPERRPTMRHVVDTLDRLMNSR
uniref:Protein kinase domain-containing protein n=1 Tax=Ananas comosus var. bracteatus TaxID=296719 RepID=A0A6V7PWA1_ANACO|nr:unnamed protein product [Ananas comosus var. bracteatus]